MVRPNALAKGAAPLPHRRITATIAAVAQQRRARTTQTKGAGKNCKYVVEQARRRSQLKSTNASLRFKVSSTTVTMASVAKDDIDFHQASEVTPSLLLPNRLSRPDYCEVNPEALRAADMDPSISIDHIRDALEAFGPDMLRSLATVHSNPTKDAIPKQLNITMGGGTYPPTHMVAVHGRQVPNVPLKVTIYPVHSLLLAAYCSRLPPFLPAAPPPVGATEHTLPVLRLPLPSPENYFRLSAYLYSKNTRMLLASLMPQRPTDDILDCIGRQRPNKKDVIEFANKLAETYTSRMLFSLAVNVQGLWKNVCALGIFDDGLWEVMDLAWWILMSSIAISTGAPLDVVEDNRECVHTSA